MKYFFSGMAANKGQGLRFFKGVYCKILLLFLISSILLVAGIMTCVVYLIQPGLPGDRHESNINSLRRYAGEVVQHTVEGQSVSQSMSLIETQRQLADQTFLVIISRQGEWYTAGYRPGYPARDIINEYFTQDTASAVTTLERIVSGPENLMIDGQKWQLFLVWQERQLWSTHIVRTLKTQPILTVLVFLGLSVASFILMLSAIKPLRAAQKVVRDITSGDIHARIPAYLSRRNDEVGELCRDFNQMADRLESLDQSRQRLLRDVSHELRSPLTRMQLSLALARKKVGDVALKEHDRMERDMTRLNDMIGQTIQWSRMMNAMQQLPTTRFRMDELVRELADNSDFEASMHHCSVLLLRCDSCSLNGTREWIYSAAENLVRNAIRFSPEGSQIELCLYYGESGVSLTIRDYGPGVPDEDLDHLFEPFFRVDETRGGDNNGTGLGMAIAQVGVDTHGGSIQATNMKPGLQLTINLPLS